MARYPAGSMNFVPGMQPMKTSFSWESRSRARSLNLMSGWMMRRTSMPGFCPFVRVD